MEKKNVASSFGRGAAALTAISIVAKLVGALYRVPLTNIVGAEGMGLYQMVFPLYTVLLAFCGSGVTGAVSRVVAKYTALRNDAAAVGAAKVAMLPLIGVSAVCAVGVALLRNVISGVQGNADAATAYLALSPSLLFAGGISVLRGYFQGRTKMLPSGVSQLIEQVIKLVLGLYLSKLLLPYGVKYAVAGALIGVSASELCAAAYLAVRFLLSERRRKRFVNVGAYSAEFSAELALPAQRVGNGTLLKEIFSFALSVTLGSLVLPITQMIDSVLVINLLTYGGATREHATALFGLYVGPVGTLINMPTVVVLSVAIAFLPALTQAVTRGEDASELVRNAAKWIMLIIIPVTAVFLAFPDRVCGALYRNGLTPDQLATAAMLLRVQALSVFYIGVLQLSTTVLQSHNKAHRPVINLIVGACVKVGLTPLTVRAFGIVGASFASAACYAVAAMLSAHSAYKCMRIGAPLFNAFIKPVCFAALGITGFWAALKLFNGVVPSYLWQTVIAAAVFVAVYAAGVILSGALDVKTVLQTFTNKRKKNVKTVDKDIGV